MAGDLEEDQATKMPRPCIKRRIRGQPNSSYFKPAGIRMIELKSKKGE